MKKTNKIITVVAVVLSIIFIIIVIGIFESWFKPSGPPPLSSYDEHAIILTENYPSDVIVFGESIYFERNFKHRNISALTEGNLKSDDQYIYTFLVINDPDGSVVISDEQYALLKSIYDANENFSITYIGTDKLQVLRTKGFYNSDLRTTDRGIICYQRGGSNRVIIGFWTATSERSYASNEELLAMVLLQDFARIIQNKNQFA